MSGFETIITISKNDLRSSSSHVREKKNSNQSPVSPLISKAKYRDIKIRSDPKNKNNKSGKGFGFKDQRSNIDIEVTRARFKIGTRILKNQGSKKLLKIFIVVTNYSILN